MSVPAQLGSYPIERELGRGGMGVVYLGRDPRLDRPVAIKVIPAALAANPDNLARFEREAKLLAAVNHPNIAGIYGVEDAGGERLLVLEYVPGETLAERLARGPLPVDEALDVGRQIAGAIEAAHEGGIVHRDLKPGNVKITPDGAVKVLDFGLAKGAAASSADLAQSPTLTYSPTAIGVILGTAGYMSPEQARGKPVDRRADIWAFACVLFECLTGKKSFEGDTVSDTIARIIEREPAWDALPPATPPRIRDLLRRCLEKDIRKRQRDIGDARIEIEETVALRSSATRVSAAASPEPAGGVPGRRRILGSVLLVAAGAAAGIAFWTLLGPGGARLSDGTTSLSVVVPSSIRTTSVSLAHDGQTVLVVGLARRADGTEESKPRVFARRLDSFDLTPIPGTEGVSLHARSPDGRWLAVVIPVTDGVERRLMKLPIDGSSPPVQLGEWQDDWNGLHWLADGDLIVLASSGAKFFRLPSGGGAPKPPIALDLEGMTAGLPTFEAELPGGAGLAMTVETWGARGYQQDIWLLDTASGKARRLIENGGRPQYLSDSGHLLFSRGSSLMAVSFDTAAGAVRGDMVALFDGLRSNSWNNGYFEVSSTGHLLFEPGGRLGLDRRIVTVAPSSEVAPFVTDARPYETSLAASPDGRRIAVVIPNARGTYEIWTAAADQPGLRRVVAFDNADASRPIWSPDGAWLAFNRFGRSREDGVYVRRADGTGEPVRAFAPESIEHFVNVTDWAPGIGLLLTVAKDGRNSLVAVPLSATGAPGPARPLRQASSSDSVARVSPDGRLVAFESDLSGRLELHVAPLAAGAIAGQPLPVSGGVGAHARWSRDGRRLFYRDGRQRVMAVTVETAPALRASAPVPAWDLRALRLDEDTWEVLSDGRLTGIQQGTGEDDTTAFSIVINWLARQRAQLPGR